MTTDLPASFFLYIRSRHSSYDPFSGFVLCDAASTAENGHAVWKITPRIPTYSATWTVQCPKNQHLAETYRGQCTVRSHDNLLLTKKFNNTTLWSPNGGAQTQLTVRDISGTALPVLELAKHTTVFGSYSLKRNVPLQWAPVTAPVPGTPVQPAPAPAPSVIQHVAAKKTKNNKYTTNEPTLGLFVAKQLLELAQMKHEMCPITAEEFIAGETAVMPCGHLFMRMAIEETFKKEPNKCPACRQLGAPVFC